MRNPMNSIEVSQLGKAYKIYSSRWSRLAEWVNPFATQHHHLKWILNDVSFSIRSGESLGIIGINGAGKSTLLKIITGTTQPTKGHVKKTGRIAALLELGMGFHPDFSGRQNAIMSAQLQGYSSDEIKAAMAEIERFADIGEYIDQPVRVYSSGMQIRLAFAVATAYRPEILIIDEALAVGDASFQRKCYQRIENYRALGTSLIFVSHDTETVKKICDYGLFLKNGHVEYFGDAKSACDLYEKMLFGNKKESSEERVNQANLSTTAKFDASLNTSCEMTYGNGQADIEACWLENELGKQVNIIESGEDFYWCYRVKFNQSVINPIFAMMIKTAEGITVYGVDSKKLVCTTQTYTDNQLVNVRFRLNNKLASGIYYFNCGVRTYASGTDEFLTRRVDAAILKVLESHASTTSLGLVELSGKLEVNAIE
jgi:lipopolysaccharide transport system ATP-binding protein